MSLKTKSNGVVKQLMTDGDIGVSFPSKTDIMIKPYASENGDSFNNNFLLVDLTSRDSLCNQPAYFGYSSDQLKSGNVTGIPYGVNTNDSFMGYREVFTLHVSPDSLSHVAIKVTEFYPTLGKVHWCFYNVNSWTNWTTIDPA